MKQAGREACSLGQVGLCHRTVEKEVDSAAVVL